MKNLKLKVPPAIVFVVSAVAILTASRLFPETSFPFPGCRILAVLVGILGLLVAFSGIVQFRRAGTSFNPLTPGKATSVVTTGIYSITRNPMYLGIALFLFGMATWSVSIAAYVLVGLFCLYITAFQIKPEEEALVSKFGGAYSGYMQKVRRWI